MPKCAEHPIWTQINRRVGPCIVFDGERDRPEYLGSVMELSEKSDHSDAMIVSPPLNEPVSNGRTRRETTRQTP